MSVEKQPSLTITIAVACVFVLREPPAGYALTEFSLNENGATHAVTLPHFTAQRFSMNAPPVCTGRFTWSEADAREAWAVFLPRFSNAVEADAGRPCGCTTVEDDGKGFDLGEDGTATTRRGGRGLRNMKSRAAQCGAELELVSSAVGTRVRLRLPHRFADNDASRSDHQRTRVATCASHQQRRSPRIAARAHSWSDSRI